jgi:hypothetical protein
MFDGNFASRVIYKTLTDDTTLAALHKGVVEDVWKRDENAPDVAYPFIAFSVLEQDDAYYNGAIRANTTQRVLVRAVNGTSVSGIYGGTLQTIADRIDTLLHNKTLNIYDTDGTTVLGKAFIMREQPYRDRYLDGSIEYRYLGGFYSVSTCER